jgi:hypothetical protein
MDKYGISLLASAARMIVTAMGMQAENKVRESQGLAPAYGEDQFNDLPRQHNCDVESVYEYMNTGW